MLRLQSGRQCLDMAGRAGNASVEVRALRDKASCAVSFGRDEVIAWHEAALRKLKGE